MLRLAVAELVDELRVGRVLGMATTVIVSAVTTLGTIRFSLRRATVESDARFMRPTEIAASRGDYSRARADLGWEPRTSFQQLIELMVDEDVRRLQSGAEVGA